MTRTRLALGLIGAAIIAGAGASPALAEGDGHLCVSATHDKNYPGPSVICVWTPNTSVQP